MVARFEWLLHHVYTNAELYTVGFAAVVLPLALFILFRWAKNHATPEQG